MKKSLRPAASLRVKKLEVKRPLQVYRAAEIPDLDEAFAQRAVPQIETGVDKEEEVEHHLQAAISAAQAESAQAAPIYIPTPDASRLIGNYLLLYRHATFNPLNFVRFSSTVEDCIGIPYCVDEEDERWIAQYNARAKEANEPELAEDAFETIASVFEQYMADKDLHDSIPPFEDFSWAPPNDQLKEVARAVYPHWSRRRAQRQGKPVMPALKFEEVAPHEADPYICFRRREVKALRKTRRTDALSLEKLKRLRAEMDTARILLEQVAKRERMRRESLALEHVIFDQQCALRGLRQALGLKEDVAGSSDQNAAAAAAAGSAAAPAALLKRRKKDAGAAGGTTVALRPLSRSGTGAQAAAGAPKISSPYEQLLLKKREADAPFEDVTFAPYEPVHTYPSNQYRKPPDEFAVDQRIRPPVGRRRVGRGGRVFFDRRGYRRHVTASPAAATWRHDDDWSDEEADLDSGSSAGVGAAAAAAAAAGKRYLERLLHSSATPWTAGQPAAASQNPSAFRSGFQSLRPPTANPPPAVKS